jgi:integrase
VRPKSVNTTSHVEHVVRAYLVPRFGTEIAEDIKPLDIQRWLKSLHESNGLAWTTISKMRGVMHRIYKVGILHEHVAKNPVQHRVPLSASVFVADHLRPAAKKAGVRIEDGQRFALHNLRHSLSNWMVNKAKVEPKTVQGILRHAKIQTTLDLYTQEDRDETLAAQGEYLTALGVATQLVQ